MTDLRQNHEARARWDALKQERDALKVSWVEKVVEAGGLRVLLEIAKDERETALGERDALRKLHDDYVMDSIRLSSEAITRHNKTIDRAIAAEHEREALRVE